MIASPPAGTVPVAPYTPYTPYTHDALEGMLITGEAVALDLRPTSFVLRAAGALIDFIAYVVVLYGGATLLLAATAGVLPFDDAIAAAISIALLVVCLVVVPTGFELLTRGRSPGRFAVGARIVRDDGGAIGFRHAFIRSLAAILEIILTFGGLAAIVGLLNNRSKRLGDYLAGTYSQYERVPRRLEPTFGVPVQLAQWATVADVARLPDRLSRRIAQFLRQATRLSPNARARLAGTLAEEAAFYVSPVPQVDAELFIAGVAVLRREREARALALEARRLELFEPALTRRPRGFPDRETPER